MLSWSECPLLALDTSVRQASAALFLGDHVYLATSRADEPIAAQLPDLVINLLKSRGLLVEDIDMFAVASGPGGFTGLRVGIGTIQGLALGMGRPVVAVPTLAAVALASAEARPAGAGEIRTVMMNGQRGEYFVAQYGWRTRSAVDIPIETVKAFVGRLEPGAAGWRDEMSAARIVYRLAEGEALPDALDSGALTVTGPLAPMVGRFARALAMEQPPGPPHGIQPLYVRRPDAELARERTAADKTAEQATTRRS